MPENSERIDKLEKEVRITQDSVLLIHKDLQQMSSAMTKMANSMETMAILQTNMKVMEERCETRHTALKEADKLLHARIDQVDKQIKEAFVADEVTKTKANNGDSAWTFLKWAGGILGGLLLTSAFSIYLWAIAMRGIQ